MSGDDAVSDRESGAGAAPRGREWFRRAFGSLYPIVYAHRDDAEAERAVALIQPHLPPGPVFDLACGGGRHLRALARGGAWACGVDLSAELLRLAAAGAPRPRLVRGDLRALPFRSGAAASALCLFSSFGYFEDDAENLRVLGEMRRVLRVGGCLVLDLANPYDARRRAGGDTERLAGNGIVVRETRWIADGGRRIEKRVTIVAADGSRLDEYVEQLRLFEPRELESIARDRLLALVRWWGDYGGAPWAEGSPRLIGLFTAREPGA
jgi:SAM-dependent methyltransferase